MSKQKATLPQALVAFLVLAGFLYGMWWIFLGPGSNPPPHRLSAPLPGEKPMSDARPGPSFPITASFAKPEKLSAKARERTHPQEKSR
jgi:hypothetical protein